MPIKVHTSGSQCILCLALLAIFPAFLHAQETQPNGPQPAALGGHTDHVTVSDPTGSEPKRIFGIIPNYRTSDDVGGQLPLRSRQKLEIASQDMFDRGTLILAGLFAGQGQLTKADPSFGNGATGYARYFGTAYADLAVGDLMTEAIFPTFLHQDPRYFRKGRGSTAGRLGYAFLQLFQTRTDDGALQFNYSEVLGNAAAVAVSSAYYPDDRTFADAASKLGIQLGVDAAANIIKEFAPDIYHKLSRKPRVKAN